jgi:hypothetical protein
MATVTFYAWRDGKQVPLTPDQVRLFKDCGPDASDHQLVWDLKVLRFKADPLQRILADMVNLNDLAIAVQRADQDGDLRRSFRKFYRDMGYSLCGYLDIFGEQLDEEYGTGNG